MIRFLDLNRLNARYLPQLEDDFKRSVAGDAFILGRAVKVFEEEWARYTGARHAVGTGNGTDALYLILEAYKIMGRLRPGDAVLVPANTYIATILPVIRAGLKPVLVEPDPDTLIVPVGQYAQYAGRSGIKALIAVHLYGRLAVDPVLRDLARAENWLLIEDAAQAHGAVFDGKKAGNLGDAAAWSFYPTKNLGALGDAGAVTTNDAGLAQLIAQLRHYGQHEKYNSRFVGINSRLDTLQAAFLHTKRQDLDELNRRRIDMARRYANEIIHPLVQIPIPIFDGSHVYHQFVILSPARDALRQYLHQQGIETVVHYPVPPHRQEALRGQVEGRFPITEQISRQVLSLPMDPLLTDQEVSYIIDQINRFEWEV